MFYKWTRGHTQFDWDEKDQTKRQQNLNDLYEKVFGQKTDGVFVEVGSYNGIDCGMVLPLADLGWRGVFLDANPMQARLCGKNHMRNKNCVSLHSAVGAEEKLVMLYGNDAGATVNEEYILMTRDISWAGLKFKAGMVPQKRLDTILEENQIPVGFEVLSVDVEGNEAEVFKGFDLEKWLPKLMFIEMHDVHPAFERKKGIKEIYAPIRDRIAKAGYEEVHRDNANSVFLLKK